MPATAAKPEGCEPSESRPLTDGSPVYYADGYRWEMDQHGCHRVVDHAGAGGPWIPYEQPSFSQDQTRVAFSQYYLGSAPCEQVLRLELPR
jgi:hypothetical protein